MDKVYSPAIWYLDVSHRSWNLLKAGMYTPGLMSDPEDTVVSIQETDVFLLIKALDEAGWIKPRLDERLRTEDLKIIHRLLDLLGKH